MTEKNVNQRIAVGAAWMVSFKFAERGLGLISTIILARLLIPEDFGVVAMAMSLIAISELLGAFSFDLALIQRRDATDSHYDTAWTLNVLLAVFTAIVILLLAHPVAAFYKEPRLIPVIYILAAGSLVQGFENIGVVAFRKELTFDREFKYLIIKKLAGFMVAVPLAFILRNYWALVAGTVVGRLAGITLSYWVHPYRPGWSLDKLADLLRFSSWTYLNNSLQFVLLRSSDFILGRIAGAAPLGVFRIGYEISNLPTTELVAPINRAVFPGYSAIAGDATELKSGYLRVMGAIGFFAVPAGLGIAALAELITPLLLGGNWLAAIPVIKILAFFGITHALQSNFYSVYLALGKPELMTIIRACEVTLAVPLIIWLASTSGAVGAAIAYVIAAMVVTPLNLLFVTRVLDLPVLKVSEVVLRPILGGLIMYLLLRLIVNATGIPEHTPGLLAMTCSLVLAGVVIYFSITALLWLAAGRPRGAEQLIISRIQQHFGTRESGG